MKKAIIVTGIVALVIGLYVLLWFVYPKIRFGKHIDRVNELGHEYGDYVISVTPHFSFPKLKGELYIGKGYEFEAETGNYRSEKVVALLIFPKLFGGYKSELVVGKVSEDKSGLVDVLNAELDSDFKPVDLTDYSASLYSEYEQDINDIIENAKEVFEIK